MSPQRSTLDPHVSQERRLLPPREELIGEIQKAEELLGRLEAEQGQARTRLAAPVKVKQGMANVPALSPLWLLPEQAAKYNIQIEQILFQRFADERTALASGDLDIAAFGPQDITLGLGQGVKSMIGVAGIGSGNDCLLVRKGEDIKEWARLGAKTIGVGAGSISWLKFAASVQENGLDYGKLRIINIVGGGGNYIKSLQSKEIDSRVSLTFWFQQTAASLRHHYQYCFGLESSTLHNVIASEQPVATVLPSGPMASTGSGPSVSPRLMSGSSCCGRLNRTEIGWIWATTTMPVESEACTILPSSTWRMPVRPSSGEVIVV